MAADGKTVADPGAWAAAWKQFYDGIWTDHISMTGPQFQTTDINPAGYPFCAGKVAMSTNYLWSTYCVADAGDDWNMAATPVLQGQDDRRLQRRHVPDPQDEQEPRPGVRGPPVPARQRGPAQRCTAACPPSSRSRMRSWRPSSGDYTQGIDMEGRQGGRRVRRRPELRVLHAGLQPDPRPAQHVRDQVADHARPRPRRRDRGDAQAEMQAVWDAGGS